MSLEAMTAEDLMEIVKWLGNRNNPVIRLKASVDENNINGYKISDQ